MFVIPFRIASADAPLLLLRARVNGQGPFELVLDTGNGAPVDMLVSPSLQRQLALAPTPGASPFPVIRLDALEFDDWCLPRVQAQNAPTAPWKVRHKRTA